MQEKTNRDLIYALLTACYMAGQGPEEALTLSVIFTLLVNDMEKTEENIEVAMSAVQQVATEIVEKEKGVLH